MSRQIWSLNVGIVYVNRKLESQLEGLEDYVQRHNEDHDNLYSVPNINDVIKKDERTVAQNGRNAYVPYKKKRI